MEQVIHWDLYGKLGFERDEIIAIMSRNQCTNPLITSCCTWDFKIQTDNKIEHDKPDIEVLDKIERHMSDY